MSKEQNDKTLRIKESQLNNLLQIAGEAVTCQMETESILKITRNIQTSSEEDEENLTPVAKPLKDLSLMSKKMAERLVKSLLELQQVPVNLLFNRYPGLVHELAAKLGKKADLFCEGETTLVDKIIVEKLADPLTHIVRNSIDHGIEFPDDRQAKGKDPMGRIVLSCSSNEQSIFFRITDDGQGLNLEKIRNKAVSLGLFSEQQVAQASPQDLARLIFHAGLSTAQKVTDVSGRGVGMDVVKRNLDELNAEIEVFTEPGQNTEFSIKIPKFRLVDIIDAIIVEYRDNFYGIPISNVSHVLRTSAANVKSVQHQPYIQDKEAITNLCCLDELIENGMQRNWINYFGEDLNVIVISHKDLQIGLVIDNVLHMQKVVINKLDGHFRGIQEILGVARTNQGKLANILNVEYLLQRHLQPETIYDSGGFSSSQRLDDSDFGLAETEDTPIKRQSLEEFLSKEEMEILSEVTSDIDDHLLGINNDLTEILEHPNSKLYNHLFRAVHSIKGGFGMLKMNSLVELINKAEDLLALLREERIKIERELVDLLYRMSQNVDTSLKELKAGFVPEDKYEQLRNDLTEYRQKVAPPEVVSFTTSDNLHVEEETSFHLNFLEKLSLKKAMDVSFSVYEVFLKILPEAEMLQVGVMVLLSNLSHKGFIISTIPSAQTIEFSEEYTALKLLFATSLEQESFEDIINQSAYLFEKIVVKSLFGQNSLN
jgi:two-component system chemotaxis sensor kinase CheA